MPKKKVFLSDEDERVLVAEYLAGTCTRRALCTKWNLASNRFYQILRNHGVEPQRGVGWLNYKVHPKCVVCGDPIGGLGKPTPQGKAVHKLTCSDPLCQVTVDERPWLVPADRKARYLEHYRKSGGPASAERLRKALERRKALTALGAPYFLNSDEVRRVLSEMAPGLDIPWLRSYELAEDKRGAARTAAHDALWSDFSHVTAFARLVSREGETGIRLCLKDGQTPLEAFAEAYLGGALDNPLFLECVNHFDVFVAWRCACPQASRYTIPTINDFPNLAGTYGLCELCGAAAVEIREEK